MIRLILSALSGVLTIAASSPNFSGKWVLEVPGPSRQVRQTILILNQVGNVVTGSVLPTHGRSSASPAHTEIWDGKADGDTISFYIWEGRDQVAKVFYKGRLSGDQITFTVTGGAVSYNFRGQPNPPAKPRQVTAKRTH